MYIVAIGWLYVALMMSVVEATNSNGTVLGAVITFVLYGAAPVALVMYILGTPARRRAIRAREALQAEGDRARAANSPVNSRGEKAGEMIAPAAPNAGTENVP
jgi:hypothetical protein